MSNPLDPPEGNWWNQAVNRRETIWLGIAGVWSLAIFGWMSGFTRFGDQNPVGETYEVEPAAFEEMLDAYRMDADWTSEAAINEGREPSEAEQIPRTGRFRDEDQEDADAEGNVIVPPGNSVYLMGRQFNWAGLPVVLEAGREYDMVVIEYSEERGAAVDDGHWYFLRPETEARAQDVVEDTFGIHFSRLTDEEREEMDMHEDMAFTHDEAIVLANADGYVERTYFGDTVPNEADLVDDVEALRERW